MCEPSHTEGDCINSSNKQTKSNGQNKKLGNYGAVVVSVTDDNDDEQPVVVPVSFSGGRSSQLPLKVSIDDAIERLGMGTFQRRIMVTAGLCFIADAMEVLLLSFLALVLQARWDLSGDETATITSTVFVGQVIGTLTLGRLGDVVGRRPSFLLTATLICAAGVATATAAGYWQVLLWRFVVGFGVGGVTIPYDTLAEFAPAADRGRLLSLLGYFWTAGSVLVPAAAYCCIGEATDSDTGWRVFLLLCSIPTFLSLLAGYFWVPESPRWLLTTGKHARALEILRRAAVLNGHNPDVLYPAGTVLLDETKESDVRELFSPKWLRTTLNLCTAWGGFGFVYYGTVMSITAVFASTQQEENSNNMMDDEEDLLSFDYGAIFLSASAEVAGTTVQLLTVDRFGRVPSQAVSYLLGGCMVFVLCALGNTETEDRSLACRAGMLLAAFAARLFIMSGSCITWISTPEILTTEIRTTGHAVANAMARIAGAISPYIVNAEESSFTMIGTVVLMVGVATAVASMNLPETSNQSLGCSAAAAASTTKTVGTSSDSSDSSLAAESDDDNSSGSTSSSDWSTPNSKTGDRRKYAAAAGEEETQALNPMPL